MKPLRISFVLAASAWLSGVSAPAQTHGVFADFSTSAGTFTVELDTVRAPRTVAHFIRLAEGTQSWMDPVNGAARTNPWYAGSGFYKVVPERENTNNLLALQGGLRPVAGAWSGGPGYAILDEATNGLSHSNGVAAMVTDGPHTGAAEFMLLLTNGAPYWDGRQTVFGRVSAGMDVVQAIAGGGQTDGQLATPASISTVAIRRVGAEAEAFDVSAWALPQVVASETALRVEAGTNLSSVAYDVPPKSEYSIIHTTNLMAPAWSINAMGFNAQTQTIRRTNTFLAQPGEFGTEHYFHAAQAQYPVFSAIPLDEMVGITFAAQEHDGTVYQYWLNLVAKTGFWQNVTTPGAVVKINDAFMSYETRRGNCTHLNFMDVNGNIFDYVLGFDAEGATTGRYYLSLTSAWPEELLGTEWGACQYAAWNPGAKSKRVALKLPRRTGPERRGATISKRGIRRRE
ncbi:MAG: peptidylprolyl isomerase [Opitutae bacterium]|nr:peptidylprolyl isomerase [Opitutae bacterium]